MRIVSCVIVIIFAIACLGAAFYSYNYFDFLELNIGFDIDSSYEELIPLLSIFFVIMACNALRYLSISNESTILHVMYYIVLIITIALCAVIPIMVSYDSDIKMWFSSMYGKAWIAAFIYAIISAVIYEWMEADDISLVICFLFGLFSGVIVLILAVLIIWKIIEFVGGIIDAILPNFGGSDFSSSSSDSKDREISDVYGGKHTLTHTGYYNGKDYYTDESGHRYKSSDGGDTVERDGYY